MKINILGLAIVVMTVEKDSENLCRPQNRIAIGQGKKNFFVSMVYKLGHYSL